MKTNLGHLETAAGVAGLVKAMLVLKHRQIPASLHFETPNPHIDFERLKLRVNSTLEPFPETDGARMVGVNSFGFGGANAHVILEEAAAASAPRRIMKRPTERAWPIVLSARSEEALRGSAMQLAQWLDERSHRQWRFAGAARSRLFARRAAQSPPVSPHHRRAIDAELVQELDGFRRETGEREGAHAPSLRAAKPRRASPSS